MSDSQILDIIAMGFNIFGFLWHIVLVSTLIYKSGCCCINMSKTEPAKINKPVLYTVVTMLIAAIFTFLNNLIKGIFIQLNGSDTYPIFGYIPWITFIIACIALYTFLFLRLFYSFKDSEFAMSSTAIKYHIFAISWMTICIIIEAIAYNLGSNFVLLLATLCSTLVSTIGIIHLLIYFNRGLFKLILTQKSLLVEASIMSKSKSISITPDNNIQSVDQQQKHRSNHIQSVDLNSAQKALLITVTKHNLLSSMIICNLFFFILILIILLISGAIKYDIIRRLYFWSFQVLAELTTLFMWLSFSINDTYYYCLCRQCDGCCAKLCDIIASHKINKNNNNQNHIDIDDNPLPMELVISASQSEI